MAEIFDFDPVDDNNTTRWPENMLAATVNDSARKDEGILSRWYRDSTPYAQCSGTSTAYTLTSSRTITSLSATTMIVFRANVTCSAGVTFNLNGTGAFSIIKGVATALSASDIVAGQVVLLAWDATNSKWQMLSQVAQGLNSSTFGLKIGDVKLSLASTPDAGFVRLTENAQALSKTGYPDLNAWASAQGYPWGSAATTFNVPGAGGYFLRFGSSTSAVDPSGPRTPGTTQSGSLGTHTHTFSATTGTESQAHTHSYGGNTTTPGGGAPSIFGTTGGSYTTSNNSVQHTHDVSGTTAATGGTETRPVNIVMYADMLAIPASVASGLIGVGGLAFKFNSATTASDPGGGYFSINNATPSSATAFYISETDANGASVAPFLGYLPINTLIFITKVGAPNNYISFTLTSTEVDHGAWDAYTITSASSNGTIANGDSVSIQCSVAGATGAAGTTLPEMTAAQFWNNTADKAVSTDTWWTAHDNVALTDAGTVATDLGVGINFTLTLGGNRTMGNPTNATKVGQRGHIRILQDATGSRTLAWAANWKFNLATAPTLSTAANKVDVCFYTITAANEITVHTFAKGTV